MPGNVAVSVTDMTQRAYDCIRQDDLAERTYQGYWYSGVVPIRRYCEQRGIEMYSTKLMAECVTWFREQYEQGFVYSLKFQHVRKIVGIMEDLANGLPYRRWTLARWYTVELRDPFCAHLTDYLEYMRKKGYRESTVRNNGPVIKHFLMYAVNLGYTNVQQFTQEDAVNYIAVLAENYNCLGNALSILRRFGSWLYSKGLIKIHLDTNFSIKIPVHTKLHEGFSDEEVAKIINGIDRSTVCGKRDYAILMLAIHTGLRGVDVLTLTFDSIDWVKKEIHLIQSKTSQALTLPVPTSALNAIADYVLNARPESQERSKIFLRSKKPYEPMKTWTSHTVVRRNAEKVGLKWAAEERKGFHSFRRTIASWMLEAEVPLEMITEILGQRNTNSARPYIAVHQTKLADCALNLQLIPMEREELR